MILISVTVNGVDGETSSQLTTARGADDALAYLLRHDHDGSSVTVSVAAEDEHAYRLLTMLGAKLPDA